MHSHMEMRKVPSERSIGSVRNVFIGAMIISSLSTILLITTLPIMLFRLDALYETISIEKLAFHKAANALDEQIEFLLQPISMRKQRLVRQVDFLAKLERKSFKGRMRMVGKTIESDKNLPPAQFDKKYVQPSLQVFDRQVPRHTSEMRQHILEQLRALSPPTFTQNLNNHAPKLKYNEHCPRGPQGEKGKNGENGLNGANGLAGIPGISWKRYGQKGNCIVCPGGRQGPRGMKGRVGMPGAMGKSAVHQNQGPPGEIGDVGEPGIRGINGVDGLDGENAIKYIKGLPGIKGERGNRGEIGDIGENGIDETYSEVGDPGDIGVVGSQGRNGENGLIGEIGDRGEDAPKFCECPERSPHVSGISDKIVSYYPYYRIF